jgi:hypothetical protein
MRVEASLKRDRTPDVDGDFFKENLMRIKGGVIAVQMCSEKNGRLYC